MRFEKIKANPEMEMKKVCEFLQVEFEPSMLDEINWKEDTGESWKN